MAPRLELQALLEALLGSRNVYFQPPSNIQMEFPCIIYRRNDIDIFHADNLPFKNCTRYQVIGVSRDPDDDLFEKIPQLPMVSFDRSYTADNLNHDVYNLYF
jgi:hypothetical protein